ncbi:MAG: hypothetical protein E7284_06000 [Lachnospiraceae bacterium]|nr:hypothetical protein [Lachnospiraceae bacterium]
MLKKALVIVCALSVFMMSGCSILGLVSKSDYEMAMGDRDYYMAEYERLTSENEDLDTQVTDLTDEVATLETEKAELETALEETLVAYEAAQYPGLDEEVLVEVTDDVAIKVRMPEDFREVRDGEYEAKSDASYILIDVSDSYAPEMDLTQSEFEEAMEYMLEESGLNVETFEVTQFKDSEINGYDTLLIEMKYSIEGLEIWQIQFIIEADGSSCSIIYTTSPDLGWYDEFEASVNSIQVGVAE